MDCSIKGLCSAYLSGYPGLVNANTNKERAIAFFKIIGTLILLPITFCVAVIYKLCPEDQKVQKAALPILQSRIAPAHNPKIPTFTHSHNLYEHCIQEAWRNRFVEIRQATVYVNSRKTLDDCIQKLQNAGYNVEVSTSSRSDEVSIQFNSFP